MQFKKQFFVFYLVFNKKTNIAILDIKARYSIHSDMDLEHIIISNYLFLTNLIKGHFSIIIIIFFLY